MAKFDITLATAKEFKKDCLEKIYRLLAILLWVALE